MGGTDEYGVWLLNAIAVSVYLFIFFCFIFSVSLSYMLLWLFESWNLVRPCGTSNTDRWQLTLLSWVPEGQRTLTCTSDSKPSKFRLKSKGWVLLQYLSYWLQFGLVYYTWLYVVCILLELDWDTRRHTWSGMCDWLQSGCKLWRPSSILQVYPIVHSCWTMMSGNCGHTQLD